jgi:uncharacterized protein YjaG (DUF416 family)
MRNIKNRRYHLKLKEFLETSGLYTKQKLDSRVANITLIDYPSIKMFCNSCESEETFVFQKEKSSELMLHVILDERQLEREVMTIEYECANCGNLEYFLIELNEKHDTIKKVGQSAGLNINVEKRIEKLLSQKVENYKKGLICESHGYGIGAFAYYRRIVEEIIDELLEKIKDIIEDDEKEEYIQILDTIKSSSNATDKINIIKNQLPESLKNSSHNHFKIIYSILSAGIHSYSDKECLELSINLRKTFINLIQSLEIHSSDKKLDESTKKLLEKKNNEY